MVTDALPPISPSIDPVKPFRVMTVMQRAAELEAAGHSIVHMEVGEPDFTTADPIIMAAKRALDAGHTRYTNASGVQELRAAISSHYESRYAAEVPAERILVTPGASAGLMLLAHLLVGPGDGVLLSDPAYPCVRNFIHLVNGLPQLIPVGQPQNFQPTLELLERFCNEQTRSLWLASPGNPSGTILERERLAEIVEWAQRKGLSLIVDEIYHGLHYVDDMPSVTEFSDRSFVVNSFSKYFGMTGWRLGWIVVPEGLVRQATILAQNLYISPPSMAQQAAITALSESTRPLLEERRSAFRERRDYLQGELEALGFILPEITQGAFYLYADISRLADDAEIFCRNMLEKHGVAITPGSDFGNYRSELHVRFAFTTSMENLRLAAKRLRSALT